ncbi:helix-turn-helix domain-containing protein [Tyzzerella sp. OttesenSCG-928-J15]|nr:helix-turn-helix domain-containing protein [Tyzzerella sp. OttesenSCG-928-J15]
MTFIERLQTLMNAKDISAYRLSKDIGISESLIGKWKKNPKAEPSSSVLLRLCEYFRVSPKWLLTGTGDMNEQKQASDNNATSLTLAEQILLDNFNELETAQKKKLVEMSVRLKDEAKLNNYIGSEAANAIYKEAMSDSELAKEQVLSHQSSQEKAKPSKKQSSSSSKAPVG